MYSTPANPSPSATPGSGITERRKIIDVYYTGKNYNATNASRTDITANLRIGQPLMMDGAGFDQGVGLDATLPYTAALGVNMPIGIVVDIPRGNEQGGWVKVCTEGPCLALTNDASVAVFDSLTVANGSAFFSDEASPTFLGKAIALQASSDTNEKLIAVQLLTQCWGA